MMSDVVGFHATARGLVQGVGFRYFVITTARELGLKGYTRNLPSGSEVEVAAEGEREALGSLLELIGIGPPGAEVDHVEVSWTDHTTGFSSFDLRR
ncbi:MAG: Acylphosphatase [Dehalococcoidia bacterium]|nr:Acylphosphatase [Dehalococcoidia bacterium]